MRFHYILSQVIHNTEIDGQDPFLVTVCIKFIKYVLKVFSELRQIIGLKYIS